MKKIKFFLIIFSLYFFSNCGFEPLYSSHNKNNEELLHISVKNIKDRSGQILKNDLSKKLNPQNKKTITKYYLFVDLVENIEEMGIRKDMSATRSHLRIKAEYKLQTVKDGEIILKSTIEALSSYDIVESIYATIIAEKDARNKGLKIINDSIINELAIYFINK